ncbi:hypothetical protein BGZ60DRAFT_521403 [Tricladium varicosporioides]|nr:hypothetical protein BGZ60DRAFT_521403 [Hymenoscyphus varicosporioides]
MAPGGGLSYRPKSNSHYDSDDSDGDVDDVLVVGIDFGTTYSGAAWATAEDFKTEQINVITSWPNYGREEGKAPTELYYDEDEQAMWGYGIPNDATPVSWFKLLLVKDEDLTDELRRSEFLLRARTMERENGKSAVEFIADYLRALWAHILDTIVKARGESVVDALPLHIVITVPAIWKGYAREEMKKAAKLAGILDRRSAGPTTITFAPEPEAAALATLSEPGRKSKAGDVYVICDAGGGTVDLITYVVDSPNRPIQMHEAVEGTGGLCGGIFIDQAFEDMCKSRLKRKWDRLSKAGIKGIMKNEWEVGAKAEFKPSNTKSYIVTLPAEIKIGGEKLDDDKKEPIIKDGRIHFKSYHLQEAFAKSFSGIQKLLDEQIARARSQGSSPTGIILVGGLGGSPYLYEVLKAKYGKAGISILQSTGMKPRTAICRGAVYKGFMEGAGGKTDVPVNMINVISTVSRLSFGIRVQVPFKNGKHLEEDKIWDEDDCEWKATNQMDWYLKRGENVSKKDPVRKSYYRTYRKDFGGTWEVSLLQCEEVTAPTRKTAEVKTSCTISCTLDKPFSSLQDFVNERGEKMKKLSFEVEMVPSGASLEFVVYIDGRRQGAQNASVHFQ